MPKQMGIMIIVIKAVNLTREKKLNEMKKMIKLLKFWFESAKVEMILLLSLGLATTIANVKVAIS